MTASALRYLLLSPFLDGDPLRGIEREVVHVANELAALGRQVRVVATDCRYEGGRTDGRPDELVTSVSLTRLPGRIRTTFRGVQQSGAPLLVRGLRREIAAFEGTIIVWNAGWPLTLRSVRALRARTADVYFRTYWHPSAARHRIHRRAVDWSARQGFGVAGTLVPASMGEAAQLTQLVRHSQGRPTISVWPPGCDTAGADSGRPDGYIRNLIGATPTDLVLLSVGSASFFKGTDDLLEAALTLEGQVGRRVHVVIVGGDSPEAACLLAAHRESGGTVTHLRDLNDRDKLAAIDAADLLVMCSRYEAYGFVALEALSRRRPVVAYDDFPSAPDLVAYGATLVQRSPGTLAAGIQTRLGQPINWADYLSVPRWSSSVARLDHLVSGG